MRFPHLIALSLTLAFLPPVSQSIAQDRDAEVVGHVQKLSLELIASIRDTTRWRPAIMDCVVHSKELASSGVGEAVVAILESSFKDNGFRLVERRRLEEVVAEIRLGMSGLLDPEKISEVGKMAGANVVVMGSVTEMGNTVVINVKLVEVESSEIMFSTFTTVDRTAMIQESKKYVVFVGGEKSLIMAGLGSALLPGLGQIYINKKFAGLLFFTSVTAGVAGIFLGEEMADNINSEYEDIREIYRASLTLSDIEKYRGEMENKNKEYQNMRKLQNAILVTTSVLYVYGIINAVMGARKYNETMKEKYSINAFPTHNGPVLAFSINF